MIVNMDKNFLETHCAQNNKYLPLRIKLPYLSSKHKNLKIF